MIGSTISFFTAFGLEVLLHSDELWTRLSVGILIAIIILLVCWCVWTGFTTSTDFSFLSSVHALKEGIVNFTRGLRGVASEPGSDAGVGGDGEGGGRSGIRRHRRSAALKEAFNRLRPRRTRASTSATLVSSSGGNESGPPDVMEMGKIKKVPSDEV